MLCLRVLDKYLERVNMEATVCFKKLHWLPLWQFVVTAIGFLIAFAVALAKEHVTIYLPYFSETGAFVPEICIFSYTLIIGSFIGVLTVTHRYLVLRSILTVRNKRLWLANNVAFWCGLFSMAGLAGVAAIPMSTILGAHHVVAIAHFVFALFFVFLHTYINYYLPEPYAKWKKFRVGICLSLLAFIVAVVIFYPISHNKWKQKHAKAFALKTPEDEGFTLLFFAAGFEWLVYGAYVLYLLTFCFEYRNFKILIQVMPASDEEETDKIES